MRLLITFPEIPLTETRVWRFLCSSVTDGDVDLFRAEDDLSEEVEFGAAVSASLDGLDFADVAFDGA
jgi:hypothetical protein